MKSKYKFNPYERAVGLFITIAIGGSFFLGLGIAVQKNWFEEKVSYVTYVNSASNLRVGSSVLMSGLRVGKIDKVKLDRLQKIKVTFTVVKEYSEQITEGARVEFIRPFILGDKALTILPGPSESKVLTAGAVLPVHQSMDLLEALSGKKLEAVLAKVDNILSNLDQTMAISRDVAMEVGNKKKLKKVMDDLSYSAHEIRQAIPHLTAKVPEASKHLTATIENLSAITTGLREIQPEGSKKTIELLNESVITLKGMQKSFFLKSNVEEVREELALEKQQKAEQRAPAGK